MDVPDPVQVVFPVVTVRPVVLGTPVKVTDSAPAGMALVAVTLTVQTTVFALLSREIEVELADPPIGTGETANAGAATAIETAGAVQAAARTTERRDGVRAV